VSAVGIPTTETVAKTSIAITAILPWLWNYYIYGSGWGPEMTGEIAGPMSVIITSLLNRVSD
jgi:hypothetical protein